ncbi:DgyrCDS241 [Dimorphilus gyrociliatus]|uniref:Bardet-Biedl syndrome 2 protein homolog n=1 Tax=Dimorphilus gyrociliatus TaxID=2664684 RepID=A0A7I8V8D6_9ANNE|nr:DgyrCDS241 [Dimorphilus gyrociliatus]
MKINPRMVSLGYFDGKHPSLACATTGGKVFIHSPHAPQEIYGGRLEGKGNSSISLLNINQSISAVISGSFNEEDRSSGDTLFIGTPTNFLAYNVHSNTDLFYKETADGSNALVIGKLGGLEKTMVIAGGNCSLQGFDKDGEEGFWTVTGDNVRSLELVDFNNDNQNELIVGSEDFDIRVFQEDAILAELSETDVILDLCRMSDNKFGYSLNNGTVGVYDKNTRLWRIKVSKVLYIITLPLTFNYFFQKSKNHPTSLHSFDLNGDGVDELITGWSNGKFDVRTDKAGEVIYKDNMKTAVAGIVHGNYKMDGNECLIIASTEGELKGFNQISPENASRGIAVDGITSATPGGGGGFGGSKSLQDTNTEQEALRELTQRKQNLLLELRNYEENLKASKMIRPSGLGELDQKEMGIIPADTTIQTSLTISAGTTHVGPHVNLIISTSNETIVRSAIIFAEGIFENECHVSHPPKQKIGQEMSISLFPNKDFPIDLHLKVFVGYKSSTQFHVFELSRQLPKFSMYALITKTDLPEPAGHVTFKIHERINRIVLWINQNFLLSEDFKCDGPDLNINFQALRTLGAVSFTMTGRGEVTIRTNDMDVAADLIQTLCTFLNIEDLQVTADFPEEMEKLGNILSKVDEFHAAGQKLTAEMADHSNIIKNLIVRAEDARLLGDIKSMRKNYMDLFNFNKDLINGYKVRSTNHTELLNCLKQLNQIIQKAGKLRG